MPATATMEDFEALLNESFAHDTPEEGSVVKGTVIAVENGQAIIDVGFKVEGRVELKEFASPGQAPEIAVGDSVEAGQELAVVEAMKMENTLTAERNGTVSDIHANVGDSLAVDQNILEFE